MTRRNLLILTFGVCGIYFVYLGSFSMMWVVRDLVGYEADVLVEYSIPRDFVPVAQIAAALVPLFAALFVAANRTRLAVWITGPTSETPDRLNGRSLRALGFTSLGTYLILDNLRLIGQSASALVTWSAPSEWNPGSAATRFEIFSQSAFLAAAILLAVVGARMLRNENRTTAT